MAKEATGEVHLAVVLVLKAYLMMEVYRAVEV
jgi:hypothetical protein